MAYVHCATTGNDTTGDGSIGNPYATPSKVNTVLNSNDVAVFRSGTYTLTATLTLADSNCLWTGYPGETVIFDGLFTISSNLQNISFNELRFNNMGSSTAASQGYFTFGASTQRVQFLKCQFLKSSAFVRTILNTASSAISIISIVGCKFENTSSGSNYMNPLTHASAPTTLVLEDNYIINCSAMGMAFHNIIRNNIVVNANHSTTNSFLTSTTAISSASPYMWNIFNNTIINSKFIIHNSSTTLALDNVFLSSNVFDGTDIISNIGAGVLTFSGSFNKDNALVGSVSTTGVTLTGSITVANLAACLFYDTSINDYRIKITSPLHLGAGVIIGAKYVDPDAFYTSIPEAKVELGYPYKDRSLTNNKTGLLSGSGGETDVNKVLTTSSVVSGTINPNTVLDTNVNGTLPQSAVKASNGGTLPLNKIAPSQGGTYDGAESNDSLVAGDLKIGLSKNNLGSPIVGTYTGADRHSNPGQNNVKAGVTYKDNSLTDNQTGNRTDADPTKVLFSEPTYGAAGTEFTPSYVPSGGSSVETFNKTLLKSILGTGISKI
jgi:hypothetical protein